MSGKQIAQMGLVLKNVFSAFAQVFRRKSGQQLPDDADRSSSVTGSGPAKCSMFS